MLRTIGTLPK